MVMGRMSKMVEMDKDLKSLLKMITWIFNGSLVIISLIGFYTLIDDFDIFSLWLSIFFLVGSLISLTYIYSVVREIKKLKTTIKNKKQRGRKQC